MTSSNLDAMKRIFCLLTLLAAFAACGSAFAQRLQNGSYSTVGYIKSDGTIQDGSYRTIGYIKMSALFKNQRRPYMQQVF